MDQNKSQNQEKRQLASGTRGGHSEKQGVVDLNELGFQRLACFVRSGIGPGSRWALQTVSPIVIDYLVVATCATCPAAGDISGDSDLIRSARNGATGFRSSIKRRGFPSEKGLVHGDSFVAEVSNVCVGIFGAVENNLLVRYFVGCVAVFLKPDMVSV